MPGIARNRLTLTLRPNDAQAASSHVAFSADIVRETPAQLSEVVRAHRNELASVRGSLRVDVRLTDEGRAEAFARAAAETAARNSATVQQIRARAENAMAVLDNAIAAAQPERIPGPEGLLGRQAWWGRAEKMMDAGLRLPTIIDEATNPEMLHAIMDEYQTWARINFKNLTPEQNAENIELYGLRIDRRFAELAGETRIGADARLALAAQPDAIALPMKLDWATAATGSTDPAHASDLHSVMGAHLAKSQVQAALQVVQEGQLRPHRRHYTV